MARVTFDFHQKGENETVNTHSSLEKIQGWIENGIKTNQLIDGAGSHELISKDDSEIGWIKYQILLDGKNELRVTVRY